MYGAAPYPKSATIGDAIKTYIKSLLVYKKKEIQNRVSRKGKGTCDSIFYRTDRTHTRFF